MASYSREPQLYRSLTTREQLCFHCTLPECKEHAVGCLWRAWEIRERPEPVAARAWRFIKRYTAKNGSAPRIRQIADGARCSRTHASRVLRDLEDLKLIRLYRVGHDLFITIRSPHDHSATVPTGATPASPQAAATDPTLPQVGAPSD